MIKWILKKLNNKATHDHSTLAIPDDGTMIPTGEPGVYAYKDANQRVREAKVSLPEMNPFTFDRNKPNLKREGKEFHWDYIEKMDDEYIGLTTLKDRKGEIYLILNYATYIQPLNDGEKFVYYTRNTDRKGDLNMISLVTFEVDKLLPIENPIQRLKALRNGKGDDIAYNCPDVEVNHIPLVPGETEIKYDFTGIIQDLDELIIVKNLPWIAEPNRKYCGDTALLVLKPKLGVVNVIPQDWFNLNDDIDFGYQWITLAGRNPITKNIHGFGIRLGNFVLDPSGKNIIKPGQKVTF